MKVASKTDVGCVRENNEDCLLVSDQLGLFIVADGMGGHQGGEVASAVAIDVISSFLKEKLSNEGNTDQIAGLIREAFHKADKEIQGKARESKYLQDMGTTVVLAICRGDRIYLAHVGDSRAYLIHRGKMRQLTVDYSFVAQMVKAGQLTPEKARHHPQRNVITRCLENLDSAEVDLQYIEWRPGDYLLLCSDGLTNMVEDKKIKELILRGKENVQATCGELVELAKANEGKDNITLILAYRD